MFRQAFLAGLAAAMASGAAAQDVDDPGLTFSGYYKNLLQASKTVVPEVQRYVFDVNRLRLELKGNLAPPVALDLEYDNEMLFGNYLRTHQFAIQSNLEPNQYLDLDGAYLKGSEYYGQQRLYRGNATFTFGDTDVRVGRQRIAWGTGRFWSPLDLLNPLDPIAIEREERLGVDAILAEHKLGPLSRVSAVYAPAHGGAESSIALNVHSNARGVDFSFIGGRFGNEEVAGIDIAGQIGTAGVRGEFTVNRATTGARYSRELIALDYALANTLTLSAELYFNGAGTTNPSAYDFASLLTGRVESVARHYLGGYVSYEITPLLKYEGYVVLNLDDGSRFLSPVLSYSIRTNVDWKMGVQIFTGRTRSEYGHLHNVYYTQLQWFF
ncbi:hypothetical protein [Burkholderia ubonensis]|uniref:hypothetical protein n=1 Tax=Burkholderia ubonensis TaxID=101571 RepID=UPI000F568094|nr:hypothetical protein [Burkholderia ubonensis]RQP27727.1 hypothetical protein DF155_30880 [Burkholderia ubonensis]RQP29743.1 hypothetical protein DF154_32115 [Burkholderia ubonensis]RQP31899.1 hypothetical protein DF156_31100 [Burkholderia ubonensis]RQP47842.1 hypothetical protein DF144_30805 [Burkholderia ubonensis]RQP50859.1 hypothetical protein DF151_30700 [Burkholderia ubonensis]